MYSVLCGALYADSLLLRIIYCFLCTLLQALCRGKQDLAHNRRLNGSLAPAVRPAHHTPIFTMLRSRCRVFVGRGFLLL